MDHQRHRLLSIGSFSSASQLSLKALRLYDQLGLLRPSFVDPDSGYRYYHADRLPLARMIRIMREMDMPLATIRQVLAAAPADAEALVHDYWQLREAWIAQARRMVPNLVTLLRQETPPMSFDVSVQTMPPQAVVSINSRIKVEQLDSTIRESLATLRALLDEQGVDAVGAPFGIYHGPINHDADGPIEVCVPVADEVPVTGAATSRVLPGGRLASVRMRGPECDFPEILKGYDAVYDWVQRNGFSPAEPPREIWHSPPGATGEMEVALRFE